MNKITLSYMAGFFDGEGSISILKRKKGDWNISYFLRVSVGQKDGETLGWIRDNFGGNVYDVKRDGSFVWAISDSKAYEFIKLITPYLKYKKPQAELAISFQEDRMNIKRNRKVGLTENELHLREEMFLKMKSLKKVFTKPL
jgi:hypothetical protein